MGNSWKDGRVVECAGLEIRYTVIPYRGFKSHSFRHKYTQAENPRLRYFFLGRPVRHPPIPPKLPMKIRS